MELIKGRLCSVVSRASIGEERHALEREVEDVTRMIQHFLAEYYHLVHHAHDRESLHLGLAIF
jgi:hypothetical protein